MSDILVPDLGEGIEKAVVACWHVQKGDRVNADDDIVELVTDKASFNISAGSSGQVRDIQVEEGEEARIGAVLAIIDDSK